MLRPENRSWGWPWLLITLCACASTNPFEVPPPDLSQTGDVEPGGSNAGQTRGATGQPALSSLGLGIPPPPEVAFLTVRETASVGRTGWVASGVPLPRDWAVANVGQLELRDDQGNPVPMQARVLARWGSGVDDGAAPIRWVHLTFPTSVNSGKKRVFSLRPGRGPSPTGPVKVLHQDGELHLDTGGGRYVIGRNGLIRRVENMRGRARVKSSRLEARIGGRSYPLGPARRLDIESEGPWSTVIVAEAEIAGFRSGGGGLGVLFRYEFFAKSPVVLVRAAISWQGDVCEATGYDVRGGYVLTCKDENGKKMINGVRLERLRLELDTEVEDEVRASALTSLNDELVNATLEASDGSSELSLEQHRRDKRSDSARFTVAQGRDVLVTGEQATAGVMALGSTRGAVAVGFDHMHRYEPRALRARGDGTLVIDLVSDDIWLGARQGTFVRFALGHWDELPDRAKLDRELWAPLNHPLRAWPSAEWWTRTRAVDEVPSGPLPEPLRAYDDLVRDVLERTVGGIESEGLVGAMSFGLFPRYWGTVNQGDEIDCGGDLDPTPGLRWDDVYWCAAWTDYHNSAATAVVWAMRTGQVEWLDELATPGALRMLHTQTVQCAAGDDFFYCGQAPAGYGGYRLQFNSSHAYFDNLFLYYWLTGDSTVVDQIARGADSMRKFLCNSRRGGGPTCGPKRPVSDEWAELTGRVATQWGRAFHFVGLARDAGFLDDWKSMLARAATQYYVHALYDGSAYGFWMPPRNTVSDDAEDSTNQLWMTSLYDMNNLYHYMIDTNDAPIGEPALRPSQILVAWANTLREFGAGEPGTGGAAGSWPNALVFEWTPPRVGGLLQSVRAQLGGSDPSLYDTGKACLTATMVRAAHLASDVELAKLGFDLVELSLAGARREIGPLGKLQGLYLSRLHAAVARLSRSIRARESRETDRPEVR